MVGRSNFELIDLKPMCDVLIVTDVL